MIKMKSGTYGLPVMHGGAVVRVERKTSKDEPFSLSPEAEARLVERGVAEYVGEAVGITEDGEITDLPDGVTAIPVYSEETSAKELREIGKLCGLSFKVGMSKADMVAALDAHIEANMVEGVEVNEDGEITVAEGEDAPTFDPSEAVQ